jgi:Transcriptional regulator, AbiEi antitoxin
VIDRARTPERERSVPTHQPLADLADRQHGVVSLRQMQRLGYSRDAVSYAARAGRLHRVHRGVYAVGHRRLSWHGHCLAAVLACGSHAVASHFSAAWLWGLLPSRPTANHVVTPTRRHARAEMRVHYARLTGDDRVVREGIPITALPRTLLDLAPLISRNRLDRLIERAEELRIFDLRQLDSLLERSAGHRGVDPLRRAVAIYRPEPAFSRSGLERRFLALVRASDLPVPSLNYVVAGWELDAYWKAERFAVELDVYETHGSRRAFEEDRRRHEELKLAGIEMIRLTGRRIDREPTEVVERVAALLGQRRRQLEEAGSPNTIPNR